MNEKKRGMGFQTPAQEMQESLEEIQGLLEKEKADWIKIRRSTMARIAETGAKLEKKMAEKANPMSVMFGGNILCYLSVVMIVAKLGEDLATTHKRLADVEKSIKELSRRIK